MAQSLSCIYLHVVFGTKDRHPSLLDAFRAPLHTYIIGILENVGSPCIELNSVPDHIHLLLDLSRTVTVAETIEAVKTGTSKWIKTQPLGFRSFAWQNGYAAFSVSASAVPDVRAYIQNQAEHHRKMSFAEEVQKFCQRYGAKYDERHFWT